MRFRATHAKGVTVTVRARDEARARAKLRRKLERAQLAKSGNPLYGYSYPPEIDRLMTEFTLQSTQETDPE
jgi:hypothetical protein